MPNTVRHYLKVITVLTQKNAKVRYRNLVLGFLWSVLNPLASMLILTLVFSFLPSVSTIGYPAWLLPGTLIRRFFSVDHEAAPLSILEGKMYSYEEFWALEDQPRT